MKVTQYFLEMRNRPDPAIIELKWIEDAVRDPEFTEVQSDGRIRKGRWVEREGKFLRVILLRDGETVHNAFFDRTFRRVAK